MQREPIETCDLFLKLFCEMSLSGEVNSTISVVYFAQHLGVFILKRVNSCYKVMQDFMVTGLFAGQHNTKLHGTITGVILFFCSTFPPSS